MRNPETPLSSPKGSKSIQIISPCPSEKTHEESPLYEPSNSDTAPMPKLVYAQKGVSSLPFPWKLHEILEAAETEKYTDIISWTPGHNNFCVRNPDEFVEHIMPRYFAQTRYKSFQRQLNIWGFKRETRGTQKGTYSHVHFVRSRPSLCHQMKRVKVKSSNQNSMKGRHNGAVRGSPSGGSTSHPTSDLFDEATLSSVLPVSFTTLPVNVLFPCLDGEDSLLGYSSSYFD